MTDATDPRDARQASVAEWCIASFGEDHARSLPQRGVRLLEEAIEAYQSVGGDPEMAVRLVRFVFSRPAGQISQELGGIGVCLLALAEAAGLSADAEETREVARVLSLPPEHFTARNVAKNAAGFDVTARGGSTEAPDPRELVAEWLAAADNGTWGDHLTGVTKLRRQAATALTAALDRADELTAERDKFASKSTNLHHEVAALMAERDALRWPDEPHAQELDAMRQAFLGTGGWLDMPGLRGAWLALKAVREGK